MGLLELKITSETRDILNNYDADRLLDTISKEYTPKVIAMDIYSEKAKLLPLAIKVDLSEENIDRITAISKNTSAPISLIFNFLIETVADCGKIQPKKIAHALEDYYKLVVNHDDPVCGPLLNKILEEYGNSGFYDEETGLSEEGIANFLTLSEEGKNIIREIDKLRGIK